MNHWYDVEVTNKVTKQEYDLDLRSGSKRARTIMAERYLEKYNGKELYERVLQDKRMNETARQGLSILLQELRNFCPRETGYGQLVGIRYKSFVGRNKQKLKYQTSLEYNIFVGAEHDVKNHELFKAPYVAYHSSYCPNACWSNWIDNAIYSAKKKCASIGIKLIHDFSGDRNINARYRLAGEKKEVSLKRISAFKKDLRTQGIDEAEQNKRLKEFKEKERSSGGVAGYKFKVLFYPF